MKKFNLEIAVGLFILAGVASLSYMSISLGKVQFFGGSGYDVQAVFSNSGGLKEGASVVIAGVEVGRVKSVVLDDYQALIILNLEKELELQEDSIASIKTRGLIGEKYIEITPGGADEIIKSGGKIRETQPAVDLEQLISKFVFGKV